MDQSEVRAALKSLFPPGDDDLYAWDNPLSYVARELEAITTAVRLRGMDAIDRLRDEFRPQSATEKLPDWERIFGISQSRTASYGPPDARRAQVVARWRENGASTIPYIKAALAAVLGYQPQILEHTRTAMTAAHTYLPAGIPLAIPVGPASVSTTIGVADNAPASQAGARLTLVLAFLPVEDLTVTLTSPTGQSASWALVSGDPAQNTYLLYGKQFAGASISGRWTLTIVNAGPSAGSLGAGSALFVEGIGRSPDSVDGLAANIFEWTVFVDPAQLSASADLDFARQLVSRWNPAHCRSYLVAGSATGSLYGIFDDPASVFEGCLWAP